MSFSTLFIKIKVFFISTGPAEFSIDLYTNRIIRKVTYLTKLCSCIRLYIGAVTGVSVAGTTTSRDAG
jgi:hypothetical protein